MGYLYLAQCLVFIIHSHRRRSVELLSTVLFKLKNRHWVLQRSAVAAFRAWVGIGKDSATYRKLHEQRKTQAHFAGWRLAMLQMLAIASAKHRGSLAEFYARRRREAMEKRRVWTCLLSLAHARRWQKLHWRALANTQRLRSSWIARCVRSVMCEWRYRTACLKRRHVVLIRSVRLIEFRAKAGAWHVWVARHASGKRRRFEEKVTTYWSKGALASTVCHEWYR